MTTSAAGRAESPSISVIVPVKNRRDLLAATLDSILAQTYPNWEAVVVDDGSTDGAAELADKFAQGDSRIRSLRRTTGRSGACACRNLGVEQSRGRYIVFLDSDDLLAPNCLGRRVQRLNERRDLGLIVSSSRTFVHTPGDSPYLYNRDTGEDFLTRFLRLDIPWQTTGPTWRRETLDRVGPWDESLPSWQDFEYHVRALSMGLKLEYFDRPDNHYRMPAANPHSISGRANDPRQAPVRLRLLEGARRRLQSVNLLTEPRRDALAGRYFAEARRAQRQGDLSLALETWRAARDGNLISRRRWLEGAVYLAAERTGRGGGWMRRHWLARWPVNLLGGPGASTLFQMKVDSIEP